MRKIRFLGLIILFEIIMSITSAVAEELLFSPLGTFSSSQIPCGEIFSSKKRSLVGRLCQEGSVSGYFTVDLSTGKSELYEGLSSDEVEASLKQLVSQESLEREQYKAQGITRIGKNLYFLSEDGASLIKSSLDKTRQEVVYTLSGIANFIGLPSVIEGEDGYFYAPAQESFFEVGAPKCKLLTLRFSSDGTVKKVFDAGKVNVGGFCYSSAVAHPRGFYDGKIFSVLSDTSVDPAWAPEHPLLLALSVFQPSWKIFDGTSSSGGGISHQFQGVRLLRDGRLWATRGYQFPVEGAYGEVNARNPLTGKDQSLHFFKKGMGVPFGDIVETRERRSFILTQEKNNSETVTTLRVFELRLPSPKAPNIAGFTLVNGETGEELPGYQVIQGKVTFSLSTSGVKKVDIKAVVDNAATESVLFTIKKGRHKIDNQLPFSAFASWGKKFCSGKLKKGTYDIWAKGYLKKHAKGRSGSSAQLSLIVVP